MRAKFRVESVTTYAHGSDVKLMAVYGGSPEDNEFCKATPSGKLEMQVDNPHAQGFFQPGRSYYLDFSEAPLT